MISKIDMNDPRTIALNGALGEKNTLELRALAISSQLAEELLALREQVNYLRLAGPPRAHVHVNTSAVSIPAPPSPGDPHRPTHRLGATVRRGSPVRVGPKVQTS